jgi:SAM-dependent methyltransferase
MPVSGGRAYGRHMSERSAEAWDAASTTFDLSADHELRSPRVRAAWTGLLARILPEPMSRVADLGCGTGSLTLLAADLGHRVDGVDFSPRMIALARLKAGGRAGVTFSLGDAASPALQPNHYDVVLCRHVLWALPDRAAALTTWTGLLRPAGKLVLVEGKWSTGAGLSAAETAALLRQAGHDLVLEHLTDPDYWGGPITDERYVAVTAPRR